MAGPLFTIGVFQDATWAERALGALSADGFPPESLSLLAQASSGADGLFPSVLGQEPDRLSLPGLGEVLAAGTLVPVLQGGDAGLTGRGLASTIGRAGFQAHDGYIYETLVGRGGVLVAVQHLPRAADALARMHAYGGGNAAIGAWTGRV